MSCRALIEEAFADTLYPGDDHIADHQNCLECDEIRSYFRGKSWRDLKFPELRGFQALSLLTCEAYSYFLPGYLLATLDEMKNADMIPYGIIGLGGHMDDASRMFTKAQRRAIAAWLSELSSSGPLELRGNPEIDHAVRQILSD